MGQVAIDKHWPDMTIILDLPLQESPKFGLFTGDAPDHVGKDRIEQRPMEYHEKVRQNYRRQAKLHKGKYRIVEAVGDPQKVHAEVMKQLATLTT